MRRCRPFLAMTSSAESSTPLRPSFHASSTRTAYWSIVSGSVVGTISTAICAPLRFSNSASVCSSASRCCALSVPVRSVTRDSSGGMSAANATNEQTKNNRASIAEGERGVGFPKSEPPRLARPAAPLDRGVDVAESFTKLFLGPEVDRGRLGDGLLVLDGELALRLEAEHHRREVGGELAHGGVELLRRLDEA